MTSAHGNATGAPRRWLPPVLAAQAVALRERILLLVLFLTVLASSIAFIEPSPHDFLMGVLALTCLAAGVRFERVLLLPLMLLLGWNVAGLMSLLNVVGESKAIQYAATSIYLAVAALIFACLFAQNTMPRLATLRAAYVLTAVLAALTGICGYFHLFPGAYERFATFGRALGAFKDPNVFGPFLIWPTLVVLHRMVTKQVSLTGIMTIGILLFGLLLSFSRGAWFHFGVSCCLMLALSLLTAPTVTARMRILSLSAIGVVALAGFIAVLLSVEAVGSMFETRAQLIQYYDTGEGGRFRLQELALAALLDFPNGMGPYEFARIYGLQQHNQYLQAFIVYGWLGGLFYLVLLFATLGMAARTVMIATPWQPYLITSIAVFVGEVMEGFVIDTDHWRHFYLMLGLVWGLGAATLRETRRSRVHLPCRQARHAGAV